MSLHQLVTPTHLTKKAILYIRQSTPHQVLNNRESLQLQYNLKHKAVELGWREEDVEIVDSNLGISGSSILKREGFKDIVAQVTLGQVGIILSYDVTRLSRNCSDWYPLLDVCGYKSCLIGDHDGVYDPSSSNGRLFLGLKGQLAEVELNTIRSRLTAGILNKAKRGELALLLPVGLIRDELKQVQKDPNLEVQSRVQLIFDTFMQLRSANKVLQFLSTNDLSIPRYDSFGDLFWKKPTVARVLSLLKNPAYAGAFVYGRTRTIRTGSGIREQRQKTLPIEEWKIVVKDKYPAYISWDCFEKIRRMLKDNYAEYNRHKTRGVPRQGAANLHGIMYCGECGHKMAVQYKGNSRYICNHLRQQTGCKVCQFLPTEPIDKEVIDHFFKALSSVELNAHEQIKQKQMADYSKVNKAQELQLERLKYQANLAERQFKKADPDNRLVTAELERRWELALRELKQAEEQYHWATKEKYSSIPEDIKKAFIDLGKRLPKIWHNKSISQKNRKAFIRCLIDKVVARRVNRDTIQVRIVWCGGETTTISIDINVNSFKELSNASALEQAIVKFAQAGKTDVEIANDLTLKGYRSPMRQSSLLPSTVQVIRLKHRILVTRHQSHPRQIPGYLTIPQLAKLLDVNVHWLYDRINNNTIKTEKDTGTGLYLFPDTPETIKQFQILKAGILKNLDFS